MVSIQRVGAFLNDNLFGITGQENTTQKTTKIVVGLGVATLAVISWKVTAAMGVLYSAYKGGEMVYQRFSQRHAVRGEANPIQPEAAHQVPVDGGHDAHGDQQEEQQREEAAPLLQNHVIEDLRRMQRDMMADPRAKNPKKIGLVFDAMIDHPKVLMRGGDLAWIREKSRKYANKWSVTLHMMMGFRKIKRCFSCQENPVQEMNR